MPMYMDVHRNVEGLTTEAIAEAHKLDTEKQGKHGVTFVDYWVNVEEGIAYCLFEGPSKESGDDVHREAHGLVSDEVTEVQQRPRD